MFNNANTNRVVFILSLLGLLVSSFLAYEYLQTSPMICPITGTGCDTVKNSPFAHFLGVPIPLLGIAFYLFMGFSSITRSHNLEHRLFGFVQLAIVCGAFLFSVYLTFLEAFVIKAYCFWCVLSAIIATTIFLLMLPSFKREFLK